MLTMTQNWKIHNLAYLSLKLIEKETNTNKYSFQILKHVLELKQKRKNKHLSINTSDSSSNLWLQQSRVLESGLLQLILKKTEKKQTVLRQKSQNQIDFEKGFLFS